MDVDALLNGLDDEQATAVTEAAFPMAIIAAAGSGKTTVLTRRIAHRIATDGEVQAQHVLALTFTSQAGLEVQRRLRQLGLRERVEAGTFHAVALRLLRQRAADLGLPSPTVAADRVRLMNEALTSLGGGTRFRPPDGPSTGRGAATSSPGTPGREEAMALLSDIDWCRARRVVFAEAAGQFRRAGRHGSASPQRLAAAAEAFAIVKRRRGVVDFDDLLEQCLQALQSDALWAAGVRWRFRHLFVDEAQDLNPLQLAWLEAVRGGSADLCMVGDPRQAIFGFNGSDPEIMNSIEQLYPGITMIRLRKNYRCSPQIVAGGVAILGKIGLVDDSVPGGASGPAVRIENSTDERSEAASIARILREAAGVQRPWRSCAVLARTVAQLTEIAHHLAAAGVPTRLQARSARRSALGSALSEAYAQRNGADLLAWIERIGADPDVQPVRARVAEAADRFVAQGTGLTFRAWVDLHSPFDDLESEQVEDAVDLLTFHGAKGREWPTVIVAGVETNLVPHSSAVTPSQRDEEARLLYVACTRARERLVITWASSRNGRQAQASPLIADIEDGPVEAVAPPPTPRVPRPAPDPLYTALVTWRLNAARAAQVDPSAICSDESLRAVAQARPTTVAAVAALTDLGPIAAARVAPRILAALNRAV